MTFSFVASTVDQSSNGGASVQSTAINASTAKLIVLLLSSFGNGPAITDNSGNTWPAASGILGTPNGTGCISLYYLANPTVSSSYRVTATSGGTTDYPTVGVLAFNCSGTPSADAGNGQVSSGGTHSLSTANVTPAGDNELFVAGWGWDPHAPGSIDQGTFVHCVNTVGAQAWGQAAAYLIQTTGATDQITFTQSGGDGGLASIGFFFKETGGGGGGGTHTANRSFQSVMG